MIIVHPTEMNCREQPRATLNVVVVRNTRCSHFEPPYYIVVSFADFLSLDIGFTAGKRRYSEPYSVLCDYEFSLYRK